MVETRFVGEQAVAGAPTEVVGHETKEIEENVHQAPAGDRYVTDSSLLADKPPPFLCRLNSSLVMCNA